MRICYKYIIKNFLKKAKKWSFFDKKKTEKSEKDEQIVCIVCSSFVVLRF